MNFLKKKRNGTQRRGAAAVEFSLTLPILLIFLFATFELGRGNMMLNTTEAAAYEAARVAIIPGSTVEEAETVARQIMATAGIKNADFSIEPANLASDSDSVSVTLSVSFADNSLLVPAFLDQAIFVRTCELNREKSN